MYFDPYQSGKQPYDDSIEPGCDMSLREEHIMALFNLFMNMRRVHRSVATMEKFLR